MCEKTQNKQQQKVYFSLIFCFALKKKRGSFFEILRHMYAIFISLILIMLSIMLIFTYQKFRHFYLFST